MEKSELTLHESLNNAGITKSKAAQIEKTFAPMADMIKKFEKAYVEVMALEINPETCKKASRLRKDIAKIRHETENVRKQEKAEYIRAGKAIEGAANILKWAVQDKEEKLKELETYYEREEEERKKELQTTREVEVSKYDIDGTIIDLGGMNDNVYSNFLFGIKTNYESKVKAEQEAEQARLAAEKKAEEERKAKEKAEADERERIRIENIRLQKEAKEREEEIKKERELQEKKQREIRVQQEKIRAEEAKKAEEKQKKMAVKIEQERKIREALEAKIKVQQEKIRAEESRIALELENKLQAPDKEKIHSLIVDIKNINIPNVKSKKMKKLTNNVIDLLEKTIDYIEKNI